MSYQVLCPQCFVVSQQLGDEMPCLLHVRFDFVREPADRVVDAPSGAAVEEAEVAFMRPSIDSPAPFSLRENTRLLLLLAQPEPRRDLIDTHVPTPLNGSFPG